MGIEWFYQVAGETQGPVSARELRWLSKRFVVVLSLALACLVIVPGRATPQSRGVKGRASARERQDWEPVPGYKYREIDGFRLLVHRTVLEEHEKSTERYKPMDVLQMEVHMLQRALPPRALEVLRTVPIWVEWDVRKLAAVAVYRPGNKLGRQYRFNSLEGAVKSNCVEIATMKGLTARHQGETHRCVLLHELAHAVHHHLFDYDNPVIKTAYARAVGSNLYAGQYAASSEKEYFAELSCAYFDYRDHRPYNRSELKAYDPVGYRMMELTWGTPEEIEAAKRPEREKNAMLKLAAARRLLRDKTRREQGIDALRTLEQEFPNTRAATEAHELLEKIESDQ